MSRDWKLSTRPALHRSAATTPCKAGFTLIELLTSMAILGLIMVMLFSVFEQVNKAWLNGENRVETFTQARAILDLMSRELSQAIATSKIPFHADTNTVVFVAPVNAQGDPAADLCEVGYVFNPNAYTLTRKLTQSTHANWDFYGGGLWWNSFDTNKNAVLANDTILNLTFQYLDVFGNPIPALPQDLNKLPYAVLISMGVVDSRTAAKLRLVPIPPNPITAWQTITNSTLRSFSTLVYLPNALP
jgi:prepilin-type N-terminal cleavage/methylation domain-containing protein